MSKRRIALIIVSMFVVGGGVLIADASQETPREDCEKRGGIYLEQSVGNRCFVNGQGFY